VKEHASSLLKRQPAWKRRTMNTPKVLIASLVFMLLTATVSFAASVTVVLPGGGAWRGSTDDHVTVQYQDGALKKTVSGALIKAADMYLQVADVVIFRSDILTITSGDAPSEDPKKPAAGRPAGNESTDQEATRSSELEIDPGAPGVFYLPMSGMVGLEMRPEEIEMIVAEADKRGDGQTIVLDIESGGGMVIEYILMAQTIVEYKKRHKFVAWVGEAISAAAATALACDRIVFKSNARLGAITMHSSGNPVSDETEERWITLLKGVLRTSGYSEHWARPMVRNDSWISYVRDPDTGDVEYFSSPQGIAGEVVLSNWTENCVLSADQGVDSGLAYGRADNKEQLAKVLDLPSWNDLGTGQKMHDTWHQTCVKCEEDIRKTTARLGMLGEYSEMVQLRKRIEIYKRWLRWWKKAPNQMLLLGIPSINQLEEMIEELQRELREGRG
jgi:hypothetical protein